VISQEARKVVKAALQLLTWALAAVQLAIQCHAQNNGQWLTWDGSPEGTPPEVLVIESDADTTTFEVLIHGFFMEELERETDQGTMQFSRITLPRDSMLNYGTTTGVGKAELPVIRRYVAVLSGAKKAVIPPEGYEIDDASVSTLEQITVYPFQTLNSEEYPQFQFDFSDKFYASSVSYPIRYDDPPLLSFEPAVFHHLRVARVEMYPFVHVPADGVLRVYRHFKVRVDHSGGSYPEPLPSTITYEKMYSGLVANYDKIRPLLPPSRAEPYASYLIVTRDTYYANVVPLASWKRAKGLSVTVRTIPSQIPNTADDIKGAIKTFYEEHSCSDVFVLLVGDVEDVASPTCEAYEWNQLRDNSCSDAQYARVAGDDSIPDLFLGRIPADTPEDVDNVIRKILDYEKMSAEGDKAWLGKALLAAHKQDYPGQYRACKESVRSYFYSYATPAFDTAYGAGGATNADLRRALEEGRGIVNYRGHGGADCWWTWGPGGQSWCISPDVASLTNGDRTPIVFSVASLNNHLRSKDSIGEAFVNVPDGGAVAHYGASADSGSVANDYLDKNLFKAVFDEGIHALGAAVNWAQIRTMEDLPGKGPYSSEYNASIYLLLGDPEMPIRTRPPHVFGAVEHPEWVEAGPQSVEVRVKGPDGEPVPGAFVRLTKYRGDSVSPDVDVSGYTEADGTVSLTISPTSRGGLSVIVLKQDYVPYEGDVSLRVIHAEREPDRGSFSFSWQVEPGRSYAVYVCDELAPEPNWSLLGISPSKEGLTMTLTDTTAGLVRQKFYKVQAR
jgi:hypothetical protein